MKNWPQIRPFLVSPRFIKDQMEDMLALKFKGNLEEISNQQI